MSARRLAASAGVAVGFALAYLGTVAWMSAVDRGAVNPIGAWVWLVAVAEIIAYGTHSENALDQVRHGVHNMASIS